MKPLLVSASDGDGGAARAALRLQSALRTCGVDSTMLVGRKTTDAFHIVGGASLTEGVMSRLRFVLAQKLMALQRSPNPIFRSPALFPTGRTRHINASDADVVNLHWVGGEMLSIEEIGRIRKPVVWTFHDSWAFCGAEHYANGADDTRPVEGYSRANRPSGHRGPDIDAWVWRRKMKAWRSPLHIVCPGIWQADRVRESRLMRDWPISIIPTALPMDTFQPWPKEIARRMCGLPDDVPLILFGAIGGTKDRRKGWDLLAAALPQLSASHPDCHAVVFGQSTPKAARMSGMPVHYAGEVHDDIALALLYSAADVMVVPSRIENFGQTAIEALACGLPVVAFNSTGLPDIVDHEVTGYLAEPYSSEDLAAGIAWVLADDSRRQAMGKKARHVALNRWSAEVVVPAYLKVYEDAIREHRP